MLPLLDDIYSVVRLMLFDSDESILAMVVSIFSNFQSNEKKTNLEKLGCWQS